jgi:hypothetical protein
MRTPARPAIRASLPGYIWLLAAMYFVASLAHFTHNAEFIALYPGMPAWVSRGEVYGVWLAITAVGAVAAGFALVGWRMAAGIGLAAYGAFGLDGLLHYTLALCSEHTLTMNLTIAMEALTGVALAGGAGWCARSARPLA